MQGQYDFIQPKSYADYFCYLGLKVVITGVGNVHTHQNKLLNEGQMYLFI